MAKVFIDGSYGTTGLRIRERLLERRDIELITLSQELRKDKAARKEALDSADIAFLCLPDDAAREAVKMVESPDTVIIDCSTAHRTADNWVYGLPELDGQSFLIGNSMNIANPGCHASGFIALVAPLVQENLIRPDARLSCFSLTGYSGGGNGMIAQYETSDRDRLLSAPRMYGLSQNHKHVPEMMKVCGLDHAPVFCPVVADFYSGMQVTVCLTGDDLHGTIDDIRAAYKEKYHCGLIRYCEDDENGFLSSAKFSGRDDMIIAAYGNDERITLVSRFDNLGKGASGAAIQNMNIVLGLDEATGLVVPDGYMACNLNL
ncbi:MAG: N-acetyl-gamma-glutamyl-phosphate reductase [Ruminococcus sp.]|nr:N-acetyl-gamma-glutamyl-phosphate reductase [Ruminococcus sp.]